MKKNYYKNRLPYAHTTLNILMLYFFPSFSNNLLMSPYLYALLRVTLLHFDFDILFAATTCYERRRTVRSEKKSSRLNHNILFVSRIHSIVAFNRNQLLWWCYFAILVCRTPASYILLCDIVDKYTGLKSQHANELRLWLIKSVANGIRNINGNARNML